MAKEIDLDDLSNSVVDAIEAENYEEAERLCQTLLRDYPDVFDGHERTAMLREAQGRFREAVDHYEKVLEMIKKTSFNVDADTIQYVTEQRDQALAKANS